VAAGEDGSAAVTGVGLGINKKEAVLAAVTRDPGALSTESLARVPIGVDIHLGIQGHGGRIERKLHPGGRRVGPVQAKNREVPRVVDDQVGDPDAVDPDRIPRDRYVGGFEGVLVTVRVPRPNHMPGGED
jgi:hypothetical protein